MTKQDLAVWFCKALAFAGLIATFFDLVSRLPGSMLEPNRIFFLTQAIAIPYYFFVWLFAVGIGTELAAEGEHGEPIQSVKELNSMLWRCIGFMLLLIAAHYLVRLVFNVALEYVMNPFTKSGRIGGFNNYLSLMLPYTVALLVEAILGFTLAFGPRIRAALRPG
jgi:hypothetical protein